MEYYGMPWLKEESRRIGLFMEYARKATYGGDVKLSKDFGVCSKYSRGPRGLLAGPQAHVCVADVESLWRITVDSASRTVNLTQISIDDFVIDSPHPPIPPSLYGQLGHMRCPLYTAGMEVCYYPSAISGYAHIVGELLLGTAVVSWNGVWPRFELSVTESPHNLGWVGPISISPSNWPLMFFDDSVSGSLPQLHRALTTAPEPPPAPEADEDEAPPCVMVRGGGGVLKAGAPIDRPVESAAALLVGAVCANSPAQPIPIVGDVHGIFENAALVLGASVERINAPESPATTGVQPIVDGMQISASRPRPWPSGSPLTPHSHRPPSPDPPPSPPTPPPAVRVSLTTLGRKARTRQHVPVLPAPQLINPDPIPPPYEIATGLPLADPGGFPANPIDAVPPDIDTRRVSIVVDGSSVTGPWCAPWDGTPESLSRNYILFSPGYAPCVVSRDCPSLWSTATVFDPSARDTICESSDGRGIRIEMLGTFTSISMYAAALRTLHYYGNQDAMALPAAGLDPQYMPQPQSIALCFGALDVVAARYDNLAEMCHCESRITFEGACSDWIGALRNHSKFRKHINAIFGIPPGHPIPAIPPAPFILVHRCIPLEYLGALLNDEVADVIGAWVMQAHGLRRPRHTWELQRLIIELTQSRSLVSLRAGVSQLLKIEPTYHPGQDLKARNTIQKMASQFTRIPEARDLCLLSPSTRRSSDLSLPRTGLTATPPYFAALSELAKTGTIVPPPRTPRSAPPPSLSLGVPPGHTAAGSAGWRPGMPVSEIDPGPRGRSSSLSSRAPYPARTAAGPSTLTRSAGRGLRHGSSGLSSGHHGHPPGYPW